VGEWVVLELSSRGEREDPDQVRSAISHALRDAETFVPAAITQAGDDRVIHYLMDGYAFVKLDRQPTDYFKLEGTKYVQSVLVKPGVGSRHRRISTVTDTAILRMQDQIRQLVDQGIGVGDSVKITSGPYRNMRATVVEEIQEEGKVQVYIKLRSKQSLVTLPRSFLVVAERSPLSVVGNRLNVLKDWAQLAHPIMKWDEEIQPILDAFERYEQVEQWNRKGYDLFSMLTFDQRMPPVLEALRDRVSLLSKYSGWQEQGSKLFSFIAAYHGFVTQEHLQAVETKLMELLWIDELLERIRLLWEDVDVLSRAVAQRQEGKAMVHNVLVDGHNLAFRCLYAPGMAELKDSQGRPTGLILGFLRSLGSLKKRYPTAALHVVWDGSSRRRKLKFGEYKGNRAPHSLVPEAPSGIRFDPILLLKDILPLFGIRQAWNPDEEADDVIATLVRSSLSSQNNVIFSTDRDLLQLVTETTSLLVPASGSRNEILFDAMTVVRTMGVAPAKMVQLRALYGDSSDNIPGVPRVPKKILKALIQAHGSVEGLYRSGLAGLSKGQYERLRSAEPQVRINVELMALVDVGITTTPADVDPDNVAKRLRELDINPSSLLETFFGSGHTRD
jgi:5'-3' exonuclease/transcription antitermination factor NusG